MPIIKDIIDLTILGVTFSVLPLLPEKFVDLMIVDPPYNIDKNFHGNKFSRVSNESYERYTEKWLKECLPLLKDKST